MTSFKGSVTTVIQGWDAEYTGVVGYRVRYLEGGWTPWMPVEVVEKIRNPATFQTTWALDGEAFRAGEGFEVEIKMASGIVHQCLFDDLILSGAMFHWHFDGQPWVEYV